MTTASIPSGATRTASAVWNAKDQILRRWEERARGGTLGRGRGRKDGLSLAPILPAFLDALAEGLADEKTEVHFPPSLEPAVRALVASASLADVVIEWGILREVLFDTLEAERPLLSDHRLLLHRMVDEGIHAAAMELSRVRAVETAEARRLQHAVEYAPLLVVLLDATGRILDANDRALRVTGTPRTEELGRPFWDASWWSAQPDAAARAKEAVEAAVGGENVRYDAHYGSPSEDRWGDFSFRPIVDADGRVCTIVVSGIDVTDRYRLLEETRLRASEIRRSESLFAVTDGEMGLCFVNDAGRRLLGLPPSGPLERTSVTSLLEPEDAERFRATILSMLAQSEQWEGELRFRHRETGQAIDLQCCIFRLGNTAAHAAASYAFVAHDLREERRSDYALALERRNFEHLFQESPHLVATLRGPEHVFESVNPAYVRLLRRDARGISIRVAQPEAEGSGLFELLDRVYASGVTVRSREHPVPVPGRVGYFNFIVAARRDWEGRIDGVTILATDITEVVRARKSAESAQRELRDLIAQFPTPMCLLQGPELVFALANDAFTTLWGDEDRVILGRRLKDALPELASAAELELAQRVYRTGEPLRLLELPVPIRRGGHGASTHYVNLLLHPKRNDRGEIEGVIAAVTDVTEHVVARQAAQENEARFRLLAEVLPQVIWELGTNGELVYCNAYWSSFCGLGDDDALKDWRQSLDPEQTEMVRRVWTDATKTGTPFEMEVRLKRASDETFRWFLMRGRPVRDRRRGAVSKWLVAAMDIHAQKEASAWSDAMVDALPNPLWLMEPGTGRILYKSRVASELEAHRVPNGVGPEQWPTLYPITDEDDRPLPIEEYPGYRAAHGDFSPRAAVWHAPGGRISFLSSAAMIPARFGRPATVAFMIQDVSALTRTERALRAALASRDQFLSIASHELKTPLTSLRLLTQSAKRRFSAGRDTSLAPERLMAFVEQTDRSVHRLMRLVDDMLDASRIASGQLSYHSEPIDLGALVDEVVERLRPQAEGLGVPIRVERSDFFEGFWDRLRIDQVLTNLLTNALRYGGRSPVEIVVRRDGNDAVLEVADRGPGIPLECRERVFERFERLPNDESVPGLGLGLFLCREIVGHYGGRIAVESEPGLGARFIVRLPLR